MAVAAVLAGAVADASALSLGRARTTAIVGRTLDAQIALDTQPQETPDLTCAAAEVFFGDTKVLATVDVAQRGPSGGATLRLRTNQIVDEPVITMVVRVGCAQPISRRYVVLAEALTESIDPPVQPTLPVAAPVRSSVDASAGLDAAPVSRNARRAQARRSAEGAAGSGSSPSARDKAAGTEPQPAVAAAAKRPNKAQRQAAKAQLAAQRAAAKGGAPTARLRLEPPDLGGDGASPALRSSLELRTDPNADPKQRAAFAALWQVLSSSPEQVARSAQRLESLEADMKGVKAETAKYKQDMATAQGELSQRSTIAVAGWVAALLAALVGGGLAFKFWRDRSKTPVRSNAWWRKGAADESESAFDTSMGRPALTPKPDSLKARLAKNTRGDPVGKKSDGAAASAANPDDNSPFAIREDDFDSLESVAKFDGGQGMRSGAFAAVPDFGVSLPGSSRMVNAEELIDIQQQADFFVSIGQTDQAMELLRSHIEDAHDTSAVVYLDLLSLYHSEKQRSAFEALRAKFNSRFNAEVPDFEAFHDKSEGLEAYGSAWDRVVALWPSAKVLTVIEESLFRKPDTRAEAFGINAFRDLLFLYSLAKTISDDQGASTQIRRTASSEPMMGFQSTGVAPLSVAVGPANPPMARSSGFDSDFGGQLSNRDFERPPASSSLGVDIDLGAFGLDDLNIGRQRTVQFSVSQPPPMLDFDAQDLPKITPPRGNVGPKR